MRSSLVAAHEEGQAMRWSHYGWAAAVLLLGACGGDARPVPESIPRDGFEHTLSVHVVGHGSVRMGATGTSCELDCSQTFSADTPIELVASPVYGWLVQGWSGACSGSGTCTLSMASDADVTVTFTPPPPVPPPPADECAGVVPAALGPSHTRSVLFHGGARRFCDQAASDGQGHVAGRENGMGPFAWTHFSAEGEPFGVSGMVAAVPQAEGFHSLDSDAAAVRVWSGDGHLLKTTELVTAPTYTEGVWTQGLLFPAATGGSVAVRSDCYTAETGRAKLRIWRIDAAGAVVGKTELTDLGCPYDVAAVSDAQDRTLVTVAVPRAGFQNLARWFDRSGAPLTEWFSFGSFPEDDAWVAASPQALIGGGVAWSVHDDWGALLPGGVPRAEPVPAFLADGNALKVIRGGRAYALVPRRGGHTVELYAASGTHCGSVQLPQAGDVFVGEDGTLLQLTGEAGCDLTWWPGLLK
jgi:hypothetical protein